MSASMANEIRSSGVISDSRCVEGNPSLKGTVSAATPPDVVPCGADNRLPKATSTNDGSETCCPWCRGSMEDATVKVGDLNAAWQDFETEWPERTREGAPGSALVTTCPSCGKPSMIAFGSRDIREPGLQRERRYVRVVPVRTEADVLYLSGAAR